MPVQWHEIHIKNKAVKLLSGWKPNALWVPLAGAAHRGGYTSRDHGSWQVAPQHISVGAHPSRCTKYMSPLVLHCNEHRGRCSPTLLHCSQAGAHVRLAQHGILPHLQLPVSSPVASCYTGALGCCLPQNYWLCSTILPQTLGLGQAMEAGDKRGTLKTPGAATAARVIGAMTAAWEPRDHINRCGPTSYQLNINRLKYADNPRKRTLFCFFCFFTEDYKTPVQVPDTNMEKNHLWIWIVHQLYLEYKIIPQLHSLVPSVTYQLTSSCTKFIFSLQQFLYFLQRQIINNIIICPLKKVIAHSTKKLQITCNMKCS